MGAAEGLQDDGLRSQRVVGYTSGSRAVFQIARPHIQALADDRPLLPCWNHGGSLGVFMALFPNLGPVAAPEGIDLRLADLFDVLAEVKGAQLVHADPPWSYVRTNEGAAGDVYDTMTDSDITRALDLAYDCALPGARLVCWATWPKLLEHLTTGGAGTRWRYVTGGSWHKTPHCGVGYHWRGQTEPVLVYVKPGTQWNDSSVMLGNGFASRPEEHSRKPMEWQRQMLRKWTEPGGLVLDAWAGLAPLAGACKLEGRRYVGAEIDAHRHGFALSLLRDVQ